MELIIAYSATSISISGRFIFMYLLYTKKSTNPYSLIFSIINMISSSLWISYSQMKLDTPLLIRCSFFSPIHPCPLSCHKLFNNI